VQCAVIVTVTVAVITSVTVKCELRNVQQMYCCNNRCCFYCFYFVVDRLGLGQLEINFRICL